MPIIVVNRDRLFKRLGRTFTEDGFRRLCFEYGIELDDVTSLREMKERETGEVDLELSDEVLYKIELPANRYDILCEEGLAQALMIFLSKHGVPEYVLDPAVPRDEMVMTVKPSTKGVRPFVVCAALLGVTMNQASFDSCMGLQDRLHLNLGRRRSLVAIGTHDLDTLRPPFVYTAMPPEDISFIPLTPKGEQVYTAPALLEYYENEVDAKHLKPYVKLLKGKPLFPIILDSNDVILSLPPLINGDHSKMTPATRNIFIECTALDRTKAMIVLRQIVAAFSQYCAKPFHIEPVKIVYEDSGEEEVTPNLETPTFEVSVEAINRTIGISLGMAECRDLLRRMQLSSDPDFGDDGEPDADVFLVTPPITRCDILQECDIIEDVAIGFGYNNIKVTQPRSRTTGKRDPLNDLSDGLRCELALCGYTEIYTLSLIRLDENFDMMNLPESQKESCVELGNSKCGDFQCIRTSLLPTMLKTVAHNLKILSLPLKFFEVNDVTLLSSETDTGAQNERRICVSFCSKRSLLEMVHGTLDRVMLMMGCPFVSKTGSSQRQEYFLRETPHPSYFRGQHADVVLSTSGGEEKKIGDMGTISPLVLRAFGINRPVSVLELNIEPFVKEPKFPGIFIKKPETEDE